VKRQVIRWFARYDGVTRLGPYRTQLLATRAIKMVNGEPSPGAFVWCELGRAAAPTRIGVVIKARAAMRRKERGK